MNIAVMDHGVGEIKMFDVTREQISKDLQALGVDTSNMFDSEMAGTWLCDVKGYDNDNISYMADDYIYIDQNGTGERNLICGSIDDFESRYDGVDDMDEDKKQCLLYDLEKTFCNDHVMECYWDAVDYVAEEYGLVRKEDEEDEEDE